MAVTKIDIIWVDCAGGNWFIFSQVVYVFAEFVKFLFPPFMIAKWDFCYNDHFYYWAFIGPDLAKSLYIFHHPLSMDHWIETFIAFSYWAESVINSRPLKPQERTKKDRNGCFRKLHHLHPSPSSPLLQPISRQNRGSEWRHIRHSRRRSQINSLYRWHCRWVLYVY